MSDPLLHLIILALLIVCAGALSGFLAFWGIILIKSLERHKDTATPPTHRESSSFASIWLGRQTTSRTFSARKVAQLQHTQILTKVYVRYQDKALQSTGDYLETQEEIRPDRSINKGYYGQDYQYI